MKAVDYSAFSTGGPVPVATFMAIRAMFPSNDMLLNIPGAWHGLNGYPGARQSILNGREAGFTHSASYTAINGRSGREAVERAQGFIGNEWSKLSFIGIDVELDTRPEIVREACDVALASGVRPVIYTARWAWQQFMHNTLLFSEFALWNAYYDNDPDLDFINNRYGGWPLSALAGEQYTNTTQVGGMGFDFNHFADRFVVPLLPPPPIEPPLTQLVKAWENDMAAIAVNAASLIPVHFATVPLALHSIYTSRRTEDWKALLGAAGK